MALCTVYFNNVIRIHVLVWLTRKADGLTEQMQVALRKMQSQLRSDPEQNVYNNNNYNINFISPQWHARKTRNV